MGRTGDVNDSGNRSPTTAVEQDHAAVSSRVLRRSWVAVVLSLFGVLGLLMLAPGSAFAANPSANLDQCANDPAPSPASDGCDTNANQWENGNLGASKSVYFEGDSIPYRLTFDDLSLGSHTVTIEWDTTKSSKHALDYIDSYNASVLDANPCLGVANCSSVSFNTFAIPVDPQVSGAGVTQNAGVFTIYGGTITSVSSVRGRCGVPAWGQLPEDHDHVHRKPGEPGARVGRPHRDAEGLGHQRLRGGDPGLPVPHEAASISTARAATRTAPCRRPRLSSRASSTS